MPPQAAGYPPQQMYTQYQQPTFSDPTQMPATREMRELQTANVVDVNLSDIRQNDWPKYREPLFPVSQPPNSSMTLTLS